MKYLQEIEKTSRFDGSFFCMSGNADILLGIDLFITDMNFKMQVWSGGVTRIAGKRDFIALSNNVAD